MIPYDYQEEAKRAVISDWESGILRCMICHPTGTGKTNTSIWTLQAAMRPSERALWLAHTDELLQQPLVRFGKLWPESNVGIVKAEQNDVGASIILGSVQTLRRANRLRKVLEHGKIDYVITDEAQHAPSRSYQTIYAALREANPEIRELGVTATPWRADGHGMIEVYEKISHQRNIQWAIKNGWLVPIDPYEIKTEVDISRVRISKGDFAVGQLEHVLEASDWHKIVARDYLRFCVAPFKEHKEMLGNRIAEQAIIYTPGVSSSKLVRDELRERGVDARHIDGTTPREERRALIKAFRNREFQALTNCQVLSEGVDIPSVEAVLMARPTKSHGLLTQVIGRGLRTYPGKKKCKVLLFCPAEAHILTHHDLGKSKKLKKAEEAAEKLAVEGVSEQISLFDEFTVDGVSTYAEAVNLFGMSTAAWFRNGAEFSLGLGTVDGFERVLFIVPPNGIDEWTLYGLGRKMKPEGKKHPFKPQRWKPDGQWRYYELGTGDIDELMAVATGVVDRHAADILSKKSAKWRDDPATGKQLNWAHRYAPGVALTKGEAAQIITHFQAKGILERVA